VQLKSWRRLCLVVLFTLSLLVVLASMGVGVARADAKDELVDREGASVALQQVITKKRTRGPIYIAIPLAYVFGRGAITNPHYCSPSIRATNSSNAVIEELIVGIDFRFSSGPSIGNTITRFENVKIQGQDTHYFYQLEVDSCKGLEGAVSVVRCVYTTGDDCSKDIEPVAFGAVPLSRKPR
jgi:hypothetical protein